MTTLKHLSHGQKCDILKRLSVREWSATLNDYFDNGETTVNFNINGSPNRQPLNFDELPHNVRFNLIRKDVNTIYTFTMVDPYTIQIIFDMECDINDLEVDITYECIMLALKNLAHFQLIYVLNNCNIIQFLEYNHNHQPYKNDVKSILYRYVEGDISGDILLTNLHTIYNLFNDYNEFMIFVTAAIVSADSNLIRIFFNGLSNNEPMINTYIQIQEYFNCNLFQDVFMLIFKMGKLAPHQFKNDKLNGFTCNNIPGFDRIINKATLLYGTEVTA